MRKVFPPLVADLSIASFFSLVSRGVETATAEVWKKKTKHKDGRCVKTLRKYEHRKNKLIRVGGGGG